MMGKKIRSFRKLAMKIKVKGVSSNHESQNQEHLLGTYGENDCKPSTPRGFFVLYVGEERKRFVIPTRYLSHPLFKMLLEKAHNDEYQKNGLMVPCSVANFREVVNKVNCSNGMFDLGNLVEQLI
ncbi:auxin-responsive protein SAUR15 [Lactuca sativa]|uniref:auxin-responsive protein SAUR15 n=1 Tax=Lactuca sativa TaxID=4236 RepID=UPI000CD99C4A|nr:auxin-responsive protein SAUR15 [Lactuca sativa]